MNERSEIDYSALTTKALRSVVAQILQRVAEEGLPGEHFFYITIQTDHPAVEIPDAVRDQYPEEITIVLQNQFWDLYADDELFAVNLRFGGVPQRLVVPWEAVTAYLDPTAEVAFRFDQGDDEDAASEGPETATSVSDAPLPDPVSTGDLESEQDEEVESASATESDSGGAKIVQFDAHRKR